MQILFIPYYRQFRRTPVRRNAGKRTRPPSYGGLRSRHFPASLITSFIAETAESISSAASIIVSRVYPIFPAASQTCTTLGIILLRLALLEFLNPGLEFRLQFILVREVELVLGCIDVGILRESQFHDRIVFLSA